MLSCPAQEPAAPGMGDALPETLKDTQASNDVLSLLSQECRNTKKLGFCH